MIVAAVVRAANGLGAAVRKRLPGLLADRDFVLRPWIFCCGLRLQRLGWLNCFLGLGL